MGSQQKELGTDRPTMVASTDPAITNDKVRTDGPIWIIHDNENWIRIDWVQEPGKDGEFQIQTYRYTQATTERMEE
jgi:hypothetical protein